MKGLLPTLIEESRTNDELVRDILEGLREIREMNVRIAAILEKILAAKN